MVMNLIRPSNNQAAQTAGGQDASDMRRSIVNDVIDAVNREFGGDTLRAPGDAEREKLRSHIHTLVGKAYRSRGLAPSQVEQASLGDEVCRRVLGLGFLDLLLPPTRTDISEIAVYSSGLIQIMPKGSVRWETVALEVDKAEVWIVMEKLLGPQSKSLTEATPSVNAKLPPSKHNPGGGRIKALHPVIAPGNGYPSINIRLYEQKPVLPEWLLERGLMTHEMMNYLRDRIQGGSRILIVGGTRTGKTTLLSAVCNFLPEKWRVVKIEDPSEIWIDRKTVQTVEARAVSPGSEVKPYTLADGVDDAMRMSPDYLIIGEVRDGKAAMALFRALMTGHSGACTFHADTPREAFRRLGTIMGADADVRPKEAAQVIADSVDLLVQISIRHEVRRCTTIATVSKDLKGGDVWFQHVYRYDESSSADQPRWIKTDPTTETSRPVGHEDEE